MLSMMLMKLWAALDVDTVQEGIAFAAAAPQGILGHCRIQFVSGVARRFLSLLRALVLSLSLLVSLVALTVFDRRTHVKKPSGMRHTEGFDTHIVHIG